MNILYITSEVPYPLTSGYLRHFHFLQALAQHHTLTLLSMTRRGPLHPDAAAVLGPLLKRFEVFGVRGRRGGRVHRALRMRRCARELRRAVAAHLASEATDVVVLTGKDTFPALRAINGVPLVIDICDTASLRLRAELGVSAWRRRPERALRLAEIARVERSLVARTPFLLFASERDRACSGAKHGVVIPNGVDAQYWQRSVAPPANGQTVAFTGVMEYRPNHDAAMRLVGRVLPLLRERVPDARLVLAGRDPRSELQQAAIGHPEVTVTGACPDLRPYLERATVYCAPLRFASGMQNKLLEALAMEVPVVTTAVAAAGLGVPGEDAPIAVVDDDEHLAATTARLMTDPAARLRLGAAGRRYVESHFSWPRSAATLESVLSAATRARRS